MRFLIYTYCGLILLISQSIWAQDEIRFKHHTVEDGMASDYVYSIGQDAKGFVWFGARNGCSRYDGNKFKTYIYGQSSDLVPGWVNEITCDKKGRLWFASAGANGGVLLYDYKKEKFINLNPYLGVSDTVKFQVYGLMCDSRGYLWICTRYSGLYAYNYDTKHLMKFINDDNDPNTITSGAIGQVIEDKNGDIFVSTSTGLNKLNYKSKQFEQFTGSIDKPDFFTRYPIHCFSLENEEEIWLGTNNGLYKYNIRTKKLKQYEYDKRDDVLSRKIHALLQDKKNQLWVCTADGLYIMDKQKETFKAYYKDILDPESLNDNIVRSIFQDKSGNIWVGTRVGVDLVKKHQFKTYASTLKENSLSHNKIQYLSEDQFGNIWISTPKGIDVFNRKKKTFKSLTRVGDDIHVDLTGPPLVTLEEKDQGMWIGTWLGSLNFYDYKTEKIKYYFQETFRASVFSFYEDSKQNILIGTRNIFVQVFNRETNEFQVLDHEVFAETTIKLIFEDSKSRYWFATYGGLFLVNDLDNLNPEKIVLDSLQGSNDINDILESIDGSIWMCTYNGLFQLKNGIIERYDMNDGLPSNSIMAILEDKTNSFWISTMNGFVHFVPVFNDPDTRAIVKKYYAEDGLQGNEFLEKSRCKLSDGFMAFGGAKGFTIFHPDSITEYALSAKIVFNDLKVFNKSVSIDQEINGQVVLDKSLYETDTIILNHKNRDFTIEFTTLDYSQKSKLYAYILEGYDKNKQYTDSQNPHATYTNLPYGTYVFRIETLDENDKTISEPKKLVFILSPPWWLTLWFKILATLIFFLTIYLWVRVRIYRYKQQEKLLIETVKERTKELEQQKSEIKKMSDKLHEADQKRLSLFTNISHEFRTPLTLILGPIEAYVKNNKPIDYSKLPFHLNLVYRNAKRLYTLINQLIDVRKVDQGIRRLQISNNDIVDFLEEIVEAFKIHAEQKGIKLLFEYEEKKIDFWFDPDIIEKVFYNLVSNAIKYTPKNGKINIFLTVVNRPSMVKEALISGEENQQLYVSVSSLIIRISDTGRGIPPDQIDKIFDRYYKVSQDDYYGEGTGIGLAYTKELIELHKGHITVSSELNSGSVFTVDFPVGKENYDENSFKDLSEQFNIDFTRTMLETYNSNEREATTNLDVEIKNIDNNKQDLLVVEDNADVRYYIKSELAEQYNVFEASNGREGIDKALEIIPDLIISDVMMPEVDGIELCDNLKNNELTSHIPIILLTAKAGEENVLDGLSKGADDYITKPFSLEALKLKINNILEIRRRIFEKYENAVDVEPEEIADNNFDQSFIQKAFAIAEKCHKNPDFNENIFVSEIGYNVSVVQKKIKNLTNQSVVEFIHAIRLKKAAKLLLEGNVKISDIYFEVGFKNKTEFVSDFKKMFKKTPSEFAENRS